MNATERRAPGIDALTLAGLAFAMLPGAGWAQQSATLGAVAYDVTAELGGSVVGEWNVIHAPNLGVARASGAPVLLAGPALGTAIAGEVDARGFLIERLGNQGEFIPGWRRTSPYGIGAAVVDSLHLELDESGPAEEDVIAGRTARRVVLTARLWWRHEHEDGEETAVEEHGEAELWFASELPFSWLPFALAPGQPAIALPLSYSWPEVGGAIVRRLGSRLAPLGLLLRAQVTDKVRPTENPDSPTQLVGTDYQRLVRVANVRRLPADTAPDTAASALAAQPRISADRAQTINVAFGLLEDCRALATASGGSVELRLSGAEAPPPGDGFALFGRGEAYGDGYPLVAGRIDADGGECTAILLPDAADGPGEWPIVPLAGDASGARVAHVVIGGGGIEHIVLLEGGSVELTGVEAARREGRIDGRGWALRLLPGEQDLVEDVALAAGFDAIPAPDDSGL